MHFLRSLIMIHIIAVYHLAFYMSTSKRARIFWTGRSQAVRLPKEFRFEGDEVLVHRDGNAIILEPIDDWPQGYVESFTGVPSDFRRPDQGVTDQREALQ